MPVSRDNLHSMGLMCALFGLAPGPAVREEVPLPKMSRKVVGRLAVPSVTVGGERGGHFALQARRECEKALGMSRQQVPYQYAACIIAFEISRRKRASQDSGNRVRSRRAE